MKDNRIKYMVGIHYRNANDVFEIVTLWAYHDKDALSKAYNLLKPNHMQTLKIVSKD